MINNTYKSRDAAHSTAESKRSEKHCQKVSEGCQCSNSIKAVLVTFVILNCTVIDNTLSRAE